MPWWSWVLIWVALVVLLVAVLVVGAIWLFRKGQRLASEAEYLEQITSAIRAELDALELEQGEPEPRQLALLRNKYDVRQDRRAFLEAREERKDARREERLSRARALTTADPSRFQYLVETTRKG